VSETGKKKENTAINHEAGWKKLFGRIKGGQKKPILNGSRRDERIRTLQLGGPGKNVRISGEWEGGSKNPNDSREVRKKENSSQTQKMQMKKDKTNALKAVKKPWLFFMREKGRGYLKTKKEREGKRDHSNRV